mmetsp:Transcript_3570/g.6955  ORF Transcript_3570/g.6955 Transcript_3570/m.6955 type:complete len:91 (-) Transcript_3570:1164-1436(-)
MRSQPRVLPVVDTAKVVEVHLLPPPQLAATKAGEIQMLTPPLVDITPVEKLQPLPPVRLATMRVVEAQLPFLFRLAVRHPRVVLEAVLQP